MVAPEIALSGPAGVATAGADRGDACAQRTMPEVRKNQRACQVGGADARGAGQRQCADIVSGKRGACGARLAIGGESARVDWRARWRVWRGPGAIAMVAVMGAIAAVGCAAAPPAPRAIMVRVPVPIEMPCQVAAMPRPAMPIAELGADSPPADTVRAYAATVAILKGAVEQRDEALSGCESAGEAKAAR